ncbi:ANTAR domain-containing protein [Mycobacterium sp. 1274761.0]|uniref:ANTAR domain-containing protein n=1 Tax=Mycobacterium sp. 1274761.0 TaxID=1834077 RepID=UPI0008023CC0|nr:ANTAR domain-containing protein [Mycobacterium sp. 1274761.0]OBK74915.1 hypothetical protein A5651_08470 [Mycobacterium sp. 1274761.0]
MEIEQAAGVVVALRQCTLAEAFDEILQAARRHHVPPVRMARGLVALANHSDPHDHHGLAAARYEWGALMAMAVSS